MKKRFASVLAAAVVATGLSTFGAAAPATAHSACVAQGLATVDPVNPAHVGIGTIVLYGQREATFTITSSGGTCGTVTASGSGRFSCELSDGTGTMIIGGHGHTFRFMTLGTAIEGSGPGVIFAGNFFADPLASGSCAAGTVTRFLVTLEIA